ncbi:hypothetical protein QFZ49_000108 [Streptomyces turgidiscabies]|uniref:VOC domain-containing protein n=1 Tax=Streptomyces turgidiscabies TaxID=85558 RepID=A0ABU0RDY4_9ACTN|nr:hypothetical protein [Streptomyces turgidiscabies]
MIARLEAVGVTYYADPNHTEPGRVNDLFGGSGAYFAGPDGHNLEILTRPYAACRHDGPMTTRWGSAVPW